MTTIIGVQGPNWAVVGYDSRVVDDGAGSRIYTLTKESPKMFQNGAYLLGAAGDMRAINILSHVFKPPAPGNLKGARLEKFMATQFLSELKNCFEESSYGKDGEHESNILVVVHGRVYEIGEDYAWCHDDSGIYAIGSGSSFALGSLYATLDGKTYTQLKVKAAVKQALTISSKLDTGTGAPFFITVQSVK